ncbi:MAG: hypothetical protein FJZ00_00855 [Candidatus Sericytochromatia bacterium]|uniref:Uncharacterized protein n=1 Tax=Candidatus Tanganyikabacteria bacterium TaxID=2961651 RepID=A0A937X0C9_9BACT|nr:hypothetical protein [Candidatus Tanganyikabacteria bacterium]
MDNIENLISLGFTADASPGDVERLVADLRLARVLLRRGLVKQDGIAEAVKLRNKSGLLFEHCLVRLGVVEFNAMLAAMAERRALEAAASPLARLSVTWATASRLTT